LQERRFGVTVRGLATLYLFSSKAVPLELYGAEFRVEDLVLRGDIMPIESMFSFSPSIDKQANACGV
jgi:hypothetical protein